MTQKVLALFSGLIFGLGLTFSSMTNPAKVIGLLDILGTWDPSLGFVMGGAILISAPFSKGSWYPELFIINPFSGYSLPLGGSSLTESPTSLINVSVNGLNDSFSQSVSIDMISITGSNFIELLEDYLMAIKWKIWKY